MDSGKNTYQMGRIVVTYVVALLVMVGGTAELELAVVTVIAVGFNNRGGSCLDDGGRGTTA